MAGKPRQDSVARTFDSHYRADPVTGCKEWLGYKKRDGYGYLYDPSKETVIGAHVFAYERKNGPVPNGMHVCHRCDNKPCVNDEHLFAGTNTENRHDSMRKKRNARGERHGHAKLTPGCIDRINDIWRVGGTGQKEIAAHFGISQTQVSRIVRGQRWAA